VAPICEAPISSGFTSGPLGAIMRYVRTHPPEITLGEMRAAGVRGLIYCSDYHCSHWTAISGDRWPDDVRLSDLEPKFTCQACGRRGADVRPNFHWEGEARRLRDDTSGKVGVRSAVLNQTTLRALGCLSVSPTFSQT
jgi:hypothetical protein